MFELNGLFLGSGKLPEASETGVNDGLQENTKNKDNPFGAILDEKLMDRAAAKSGNGAKESGNEAPIRESDSKLQTRTLKGGIELGLGGAEPSQDVIADYAKSQGLDADLIEILMTDGVGGAALEQELLLDTSTLGKLAVPTTLTESRESLYDISRTSGPARNSAVPKAPEALLIQNGPSSAASDLPTMQSGLKALETIQGSRDQIVNPTQTPQSSTNVVRPNEAPKPNSFASPAPPTRTSAGTDAVIPHNGRSIAASDLLVAEAEPKTAVVRQGTSAHSLNSAQAELNYSKASSNAAATKPDAVSNIGAKIAKAEVALIQNDRKTPVIDLPFAKLDSARLPANQHPLGNMTRATEVLLPKGDHSVANNDIPIAKPEPTRAINGSVTPNARPQEAHKIILQAESKVEAPEQIILIVPSKISKEVKTLEPRGAATEKVAPIKLPALAEIIIRHSQPQRSDLVKQTDVSKKDPSADIITQPMSSSRVNSSDKPGLDQIENLGKEEVLRRQDQYLDLSRRLTDALGQRLTAQISRGSWHIEMELHPRTLGRIEIQLEMKNGELEAHFNASRAATRDLIQEGLPRLRAELEQHGTESAYVGVGQQNSGKSDGKPTGADHSGNDVQSDDQESEPQELTNLKAVHKQGLDIQV